MVQFYPWFKFSFLLFLRMVMYDNNMIISLKQKKRKFEPRIKLSHNNYMTKQSLFYNFSFTVPGQVKCFNKMYRGHRGQLFMNKHKWYLMKIIIYAVWCNLLLQCVVTVTIFCIDFCSSDMFTGSFTTPREETVFGSVKSACCLFANEENNQEKDSWKV